MSMEFNEDWFNEVKEEFEPEPSLLYCGQTDDERLDDPRHQEPTGKL